MHFSKLSKMILPVLLAVAVLFGSSSAGIAQAQAVDSGSKKAIVVVSFGTTFVDARKACIESVENRIQAAFPEYDVYRAFTSKIVMKRIAEKEKIHINDLETTLKELKAKGYQEVVVQTTHLTPGEEYDKKVMAVVNKFDKSFAKLSVGRPLLFHEGQNGMPNDFALMAEALKAQTPVLQMPGQYVVFMGHGSPHQHNPAYGTLQKYLDAAGVQAVVGVVEETDHPNFEDTKAELAKRGAKRLVMMPLMLVAGDHANNDMAGDEHDSWKSQLMEEGYQVKTYIHGLGENTAVQDLYVQHVRDAIMGLK